MTARTPALLILALAVVAACMASTPASAAPQRTVFVKAGADPDGNGTRQSPFSGLARVENSSREGDRIVVLPSAGVLDGGIRLKRGQQLVGRGTARITNTTASRLDGDAVRLADGTSVQNLEIAGALRGAIYGLNTTGVSITGNDISGQNASCVPGFHIPHFNVPTTLPGIGVPISDGLHNGWAGIMVDADRGAGPLTIAGNRVHDADCGDGIDVRLSGRARLHAQITRNELTGLRQGPSLSSILAIGLQSRGRAKLAATLRGNRQSHLGNDEDAGIGPAGADSEGVFVNPVGGGRMRVQIAHNHYSQPPGRGGFSANGLEYVSMGDGSRATLDVSDSTFSGSSGDVIEQLALGTNAVFNLSLDHVVATGSTGFGGTGYGDTVVIPGNNADCLIGASGGAGNKVTLRVRRSALTNCANNGLTFGSSVSNGHGPTSLLMLDVAKSQITGNHGGNLRLGNIGGLDTLSAKVESTNLSDSRGGPTTPANLTAENLGNTRHSTIDLGGGPLGSRGGVCLDGGLLAVALVGYDVSARSAWWGTPGGPAPGRVVAAGGTLDAGAPLGTPPKTCATSTGK